jgi:hypothetical protein
MRLNDCAALHIDVRFKKGSATAHIDGLALRLKVRAGDLSFKF